MLALGTKVRYPEWGNEVGVVVPRPAFENWQPEDASNIEWPDGHQTWVRDELLMRYFDVPEIQQIQLFDR